MGKIQNKNILSEYVRTAEKLYGNPIRASINLILLIGFSFISFVAVVASAKISLTIAPELSSTINHVVYVATSVINIVIGFQAGIIFAVLISKTLFSSN